MPHPEDGAPSPPLDRARHLKYWSRCLRSLLPHHYTSSDSNRIALSYFILSAIDLLLPDSSTTPLSPSPSPLPALLTPSDRLHFRHWILSCQHTGGGFCGSPTMTLPPHSYSGWDFSSRAPEMGNPGHANIAATAFALILLALLASSPEEAASAFLDVDRTATLSWLRRLQRPDGSFGEVLARVEGQEGLVVGGGRDMRYCYFAAVVRWMLRGDEDEEKDIDVDGLVEYIAKSRTYDGGIAESSMHEPHSGYAYCALGALAMLDRRAGGERGFDALGRAFPDVQGLVRWLVSRQFVYVDREEEDDDDGDNFTFSEQQAEEDPCVAFNGRCNKVADTCYCWWVSGALALLPSVDQSEDGSNVDLLIPRTAARRFLMEKTQHMIGGFAKHPGGPPDLYHSYLGLAALATMGEPGLKEFDAALAVSKETAAKIEAARNGLAGVAKSNRTDEGGQLGPALLDLGVEIRGQRPPWLPVGAVG
ncbi:Terpenoid cyclases/Protein prenyltransferase [Coniochaeta hoffmannii]|uniref:Terpenoid cyclases/Protein prenyltransferase n=1 Tax=Coniochaeta hoffmannii TaxID=91930 RepID=A0AA38RFC5_9PEZI|nr:Terpenoid cyclases/Protein prenyltransferase [Coniochaeta hoffmannii]